VSLPDSSFETRPFDKLRSAPQDEDNWVPHPEEPAKRASRRTSR
jgi:hypothetical protein